MTPGRSIREGRLPFPITQEQFDAWEAAKMQRVTDPNDEYLFVDLNDEKYVLVAGMNLLAKHPELVEQFAQWLPIAVEKAGEELGMFMGAAWLADKVGLDPEEGLKAMDETVRNAT